MLSASICIGREIRCLPYAGFFGMSSLRQSCFFKTCLMKTEQGRFTSISQLLLHVVCHPDHLELLQLLPGQLLGPAPQSLLGNLLHTLSIPCSCLLQGNKFKLNYKEIKQRNLKSFYAWTSQHEYHMSPLENLQL